MKPASGFSSHARSGGHTARTADGGGRRPMDTGTGPRRLGVPGPCGRPGPAAPAGP